MKIYQSLPLPPRKQLALVAHDGQKDELLDWARDNQATADFLISSPLISAPYNRLVPDYEQYQQQRKKQIAEHVN